MRLLLDDVTKANIMLPYFIAKMKSRNIRRHYKLWEDLLFPVIQQRREAMETAKQSGSSYERNDYLQYMLEATNPDGTPISKTVITDRMGAMIFSSMATTAGALHNAICHLAMHPNIWAKLYSEQQTLVSTMNGLDRGAVEEEEEGEVASEADATYSKAALEKMKYLDACIRESLRLSSSLFSSARYATDDIQLDNDLVIPKGSFVNLNAVTIHTNDAVYPDPSHFRPERFLNKSPTTNPTSADFVVFGLGRHACPGRFFALHELKCTIAHLVRNFEISFEGSKVPKYEYAGPIVGMENLPIVITKRSTP